MLLSTGHRYRALHVFLKENTKSKILKFWVITYTELYIVFDGEYDTVARFVLKSFYSEILRYDQTQ